MSRIIIKNLPKGMKEDRLRELFESHGRITDCSLKFTREGVFRKFAFIGYQTPVEAEKAVKKFSNSYIDTSKIVVEIAKDLGDETKSRAWSKYSKDSSAYQKLHGKSKADIGSNSNKEESKGKRDFMGEMLGDLKDDPQFLEFLEVHKSRINKTTWSNDAIIAEFKQSKKSVETDNEIISTSKAEVNKGNDSDYSSDFEGLEQSTPPVGKNNTISDLDYLKSKTVKSNLASDSDDSDESSSSDREEINESKLEANLKTIDSEENDYEKTANAKFRYMIKVRGLPANVKEAQLKEFFKPIHLFNIKIPKIIKSKQGTCMATVEVQNEKDQEQAMMKNKNFIGPKKVFLHKSREEVKSESKLAPKSWEIKLAQQHDDEDTEPIAESGRLYVRNLAYCCKEEDLEELFSEFGPLSEISLPVDNFTKKVKGFAFVTFMMPEHAVQAFAKLDGTTFQGRLLHILPAKMKKDDSMEITDDMSFKKKKEIKQKAQAGSSHNWNALFLGANAVADVMAEKYGTTKSQLLDAGQSQSLGVRMALGETQIVSETRDFLMENGVALDSFSQPSAARSKTVILVKNLPSNTSVIQLQTVFEKYGTVGRVVLPPSGISALVEFMEAAEAKKAFTNLAYTKFEHVPLYLEWAPMDVFGNSSKEKVKESSKEKVKEEQNKLDKEATSDDDEDEQPESGSCIFVKNLNFDTTDKSLCDHFKSIGKIESVNVAKKKDLKKPGNFLSMGYGFVTFYRKEAAEKAIKTLQHSKLDDHQIELKISNRDAVSKSHVDIRKKQVKKKQKSTKILVRNIPFEAKTKEIQELFVVFGELKTVRLPKKMSGTGSHRGFAFVDFLSRQDAKRAFNALCHSTHLYGRRLVLEWADTEDTVDKLRKKTAEHFHDEGPSKKFKKSHLVEELKKSVVKTEDD